MYLTEAFRALNALNEDTFSVSDDGINKLSEFEQNDDLQDEIPVIDVDADTDDNLQDSYIGKVIIDCSVCHSKLYKNKEDITVDEEQAVANVGEECPYCYSSDGFKVIGEVVAYNNTTATEEQTGEEELTEGIFDRFKKKSNNDYEGTIPSGRYQGLQYRKKVHSGYTYHEFEDGRCFCPPIPKSHCKDEEEMKKAIDSHISRYNKKRESINKGIFGLGKEKKKSAPASKPNQDSTPATDTYESLKVNESVDMSLETDDDTINISPSEDGGITVTTSPKSSADAGDEVIAPVSDETEAEILDVNGEGTEETDGASEGSETVDFDIEEFDEESFDKLGEGYLRKIYENVKSYKTTGISAKGNKMKIEGVINFTSGNKKKTSFIFEAKEATKTGKLKFIGENVNITRGRKAFTIQGKLNGSKFITESFNYNYRAKDDQGKSTRVYGTIKASKR